jgi:hypothetical protein
LLRVHHLGLAWADAEKLRVELVYAIYEAAPGGLVPLLSVPTRWRDRADGVYTVAQQTPELIGVARAGESAAQAYDRYGVIVERFGDSFSDALCG